MNRDELIESLAARVESAEFQSGLLRKLISGYCDSHISIPVEDWCPQCRIAALEAEARELRSIISDAMPYIPGSSFVAARIERLENKA